MARRRNIAVGIVAAAILALSTPSTIAQTKWDLSTVWPDGNFHTKNAMAFTIFVTLYPGVVLWLPRVLAG